MINVKLSSDYYLLCKSQFLPWLRSQQLLEIVDGTVPCSAATITTTSESEVMQITNHEYLRWLQQDQTVLSALLSSLTNDVLSQVLLLGTSREAWLALETLFSSQSRARMVQIRMQLANMKKEDQSVQDYFNKMKNLNNTLTSIGSSHMCWPDLMLTMMP